MDTKRILRDLHSRLVQSHKSPATEENYAWCLKMFCKYFGEKKEHPTHVNEKEIVEFLAWVTENRSISQGRACYWAVRYLYVKIEGQLHKFDNIKPPIVKHQIFIPPKTEDVLKKIEAIKDKRSKAMVVVAFGTGMRLQEIQRLKIEDIKADEGLIYIQHGKGDKPGVVQLHPYVRKVLHDYLAEIWSTPRRPAIYLFEGKKGRYVSDSTIYRNCVDHIGVPTHQLRRAYATTTYGMTGDLLLVQRLLRHRHPDTTVKYIGPDLQRIRDAANPFDSRLAA